LQFQDGRHPKKDRNMSPFNHHIHTTTERHNQTLIKITRCLII